MKATRECEKGLRERVGGREGGRKRGREEEREGGREGGRKRGREEEGEGKCDDNCGQNNTATVPT